MIVDLVGFGIVVPVLPYLLRSQGASGTELGVVMTVYAAAQFLFAPVWGRLSDRVGRRPTLLFTIAGTALSLLALGLAPSLPTILLARFAAGAFAANFSVAAAYVGDVTPPAERTRWMGLLGASFGIGFVLGPAIGGLLAPYGYAVPMFAAAALAALNWVHALVALREPERREAGAAEPLPAGRLAELRDPVVRRLCLANLLFSVAMAQLETLFQYFMADRFGWDAREVAFLLVGTAVLMGGVQGGGMKALSARFSERALVVGGSALLAASYLAIPEMPTVGLLLAPLALAAIGRGIAQPAFLSLASLAAAEGRRGAVMGAFQSAASLARVVGPLAAGVLYDRIPASPFWLAGVLLIGVVWIARGLPAGAARSPAVGEAGWVG